MGRGGEFYFLEYVTSAPKSLPRRRFPPQMENRMSPLVFELTPAPDSVLLEAMSDVCSVRSRAGTYSCSGIRPPYHQIRDATPFHSPSCPHEEPSCPTCDISATGKKSASPTSIHAKVDLHVEAIVNRFYERGVCLEDHHRNREAVINATLGKLLTQRYNFIIGPLCE